MIKLVLSGKHNKFIDGRSKRKEWVSWIKNKHGRLLRILLPKHTFEEWIQLKEKYSYTCPSCRIREPYIQLTVDHIIPVSLGGTDEIDNIQPLCRSCNSKKNTKIIKYDYVN